MKRPVPRPPSGWTGWWADHQSELGLEEALNQAGYSSCAVLLQNGALTVIVASSDMTAEASAAILSLCTAHTDIGVENIRIMARRSLDAVAAPCQPPCAQRRHHGQIDHQVLGFGLKQKVVEETAQHRHHQRKRGVQARPCLRFASEKPQRQQPRRPRQSPGTA